MSVEQQIQVSRRRVVCAGPRVSRVVALRVWLGALLAVCGCVVCVCLAVGAGPASAAGLEFEFGGQGEGAGQLEGPSGVAVDQLTGDVFVADSDNNRIDEFSASGRFERAWGWEVNRKSPRAELQECTIASECQAGKGVGGAGALNLPEGIAIDSTLGSEALYVLDHDNNRVEKFSLVSGHEGEFLAMWGGGVNSAGGNVCTKAEAAKCQSGKEGTGHMEFKDLGVQGAIAIGAGGAVYVGDYRRVQWFSGEGVYEGSFEVKAEQRVEALAVSTAGAGQVYVTVSQTKEEGFEESDIPAEVWCYSVAGGLEHKIVLEQQPLNSSGGVSIWLAVDGSGKLFVDEFVTETTNEKVTQYVTEYGSGFEELGRYAPPGGESEKAYNMKETGENGNRKPGGLALSESAKVASGFLLGFREHVEDVVRGEPAPPLGPSVENEEGVAEPGASATLKASVDPQGKETEYYFEYGSEVAHETRSTPVTIEPKATEPFNSVPVDLKLTGLTPKATYHFHVVAKNGNGGPNAGEDVSFEALPAVAVEGLSAVEVTGDSAELRAQVDPVGTDTHYHFEWAAEGEGEHEGPSVDAGAGSQNVAVSEPLRDLRAGTVYTFRIVATNALGEASTSARFTTQSVGALPALLDGRSWEQVSPPDKDVANITLEDEGSGPLLASPSGDAITYKAEGGSEVGTAGEPLASQNVSRHGPGGWSTRDIASPNAQRYNPTAGTSGEYQMFSRDLERAVVEPPPYTPLSQWTVGRERTPYVRDEAGCPPNAASLEVVQDSECFTPLLTDVGPYADVGNVEYGGPPSSGYVRAVAATPDLSHVVLHFSGGPELIEGTGGGGLYEWDAGKLTLLSRSPAGKGCDGMLGIPGNFHNFGFNSRNALSPNGELAVWAGENNPECADHLYLRDVAGERTVQLDAVRGGSGTGEARPYYQDASVGDEHVFFTDSQQLTQGSTAGGSGNAAEFDLYEAAYDPADGSVSVTDMTSPVNSGEHADVLDVAGVSEDGSVVYAIARGVLSAEANTRGERAVYGQPNLYELERVGGVWRATFIAMLSPSDLPDWGLKSTEQGKDTETGVAVGGQELGIQTTRVSPNGHWLAFMSDRSLTGYDNEDVTSRTLGERVDEEAFLYDANDNRLVCASCDPTGARPHGLLINENESGENPEPLIDRERVWAGRWVAAALPVRYAIGQGSILALEQSRYLSNGGRLFFDGVDALVPGAQDVTSPYEYEPPTNGETEADGGHDTCMTASSAYVASAEGCLDLLTRGQSSEESVFMDASENGDDVFVLTSEKLAESDRDSAYDVYDAHVCGAGWECPSQAAVSPPCITTESCRSAPASQPGIYGASGTATFSGPGNPAPATQTGGANTKKTTKKKTTVKCKKGRVRKKVKKREVCVKKANRAKTTKRRAR